MYQFIHIETYAREASTKTPTKSKAAKAKASKAKASTPQERLAALGGANAPKGMDAFTQADGKGKKAKASMHEVLAEALRDDDHCNHVDVPEPPTFLVGDEATLRNLPAEIERNLADHKKRTGGPAVRKDAHVLLAGVASYPRALADADPKGYARWEKATVKWLHKRYGDDLRAVLRHGDEAHPHIHFFVCGRERVNAKELHDGYVAKAKASTPKEGVMAFNDAMRDYQSAFYAEVGHGAGLLRDGPKRKRMDRATYKAVQREARERAALDALVGQAHADLLDVAGVEGRAAADLRRKAEQEAAALAVAQALVAAERAALNERSDQLQRDRAAVDADWTRAREAKAKAEALEAKADKQRAALDKQAIQLERAKAKCDQEALQLRDARALNEASSQTYRTKLAGLGALGEVAAMVRKPGMVGMLEYLDQNPQAREVVEMMKAEPVLARSFIQIAQPHESLGGPEPVSWVTKLSQASEDYLGTLDAEREQRAKNRDSGMDLGM
jgi:hypothetical protein